jgi:euchromatic histone-lysine N-methyltransferase
MIQPCLWDHHDPRLVRLCLFAAEDIPPLTELCYDYGEVYEEVMLDGASLPSLKMGSR